MNNPQNLPKRKYSNYLTFSRPSDLTVLHSTSNDLPKLAYLRVELTRARPHMTDFVVRVATPKWSLGEDDTGDVQPKVQNTVVTLRANKEILKEENLTDLCKSLFKELSEKEDSTHEWENANPEYLAEMLRAPFKFFVSSPNCENIDFSTDALR